MNYIRQVSIEFYLFFFFIIALVIGNAAVNIVTFLIFIFVIFNIKKIEINFQTIILFFFFFLIIICSIIKNQNYNDLSLLRFFFRSLFGSLLYRIISEEKKIFITLIFGVFVVSLDAILIEYFNINIFLSDEYNSTTQNTVSLFRDEQIFGSYLSKLLILIISYTYLTKIKLKINISNLFYLFVICCGLFAVLISDERRAILEIISAFVLLNIIRPEKKKIIINSFVSTILILIIFLNPTFKEKIITKSLVQFGLETNLEKLEKNEHGILFLNNSSITNNQYYAMYKTAFNIWLDNKFFGGGNKSYREICKDSKYEYDDKYSLIRCNTHPHSVYMQILSEFGAISFILFILLNVILIFRNLNTDKNYLNIIPSLILLIVLLLPLPSGNIFSTWIGSIFWFNLGILLNVSKYKIK